MPQATHAQLACLEYTKGSNFAPGAYSSSRSIDTATPDLLSDASSQASWRRVNSQSSAQTTPDSTSHIQPTLLSAPHLGALQDQVNLVDVGSWRDGVEREAVALPPALRLNPRRSKPHLEGQTCPPSTLTRQPERRLCFVSSLVIFAAGLISAIWPLSSPVLHDTHYAHSVLPLQDFITETLRRSKTSYSTLQVAMFYLILLKDKLPRCDFTQEQPSAGHCRAMQCGRRMFLSALMLASKFLQDRNYSTRAWGKITGLPTLEINRNELSFLEAVNWKLHVSKEKFERWSHIVISLCGPPPPGARSFQPSLVETLGWAFALERLSADCTEDFSSYRDQSACHGYALKNVDLIGLLTPPSSPPDTASDQGDSIGEDEKVERTEESFATPLAPPPAPYQANLPTPRGTPRLAPGQCATYVPDNRCRESASALAMLKFSARPASRELCPPPSKPCPVSHLRTQSRRSSISSCVSSAISVSTSNSSPPSLCSDLSSMPSRSRSSSISETDAMAHLRAQSSERAMKLPWVSSPKYAPVPSSDCSSTAGANRHWEGTTIPASESDPARYLFPIRTHAVPSQPVTQPVIYDECAKRSSMRRSSKMKNKRSHSKTDICALVNIPEDDAQSLVRKELMADIHQRHPIAVPRIDPTDDSRSGSANCKRNRRTIEQTAAVDHARLLLRKQCLEKRMMPCRRRTSSQTVVYALGR